MERIIQATIKPVIKATPVYIYVCIKILIYWLQKYFIRIKTNGYLSQFFDRLGRYLSKNREKNRFASYYWGAFSLAVTMLTV